MPDPLSFDTLRTWDGSQSRAFEELAYQLLKEDAPVGSPAVRTGNPDGGVEWYARPGDGREHGWQAKHVRGIDALLTAMTSSVRRVALERRQLRRLTFVISWNLATSTRANQIKSQREKYEDKILAWKRDIEQASEIEFCLVQGSDLLDRLARPEHRGRRWFWWQETTLGTDWFAQVQRQQAQAAGERYQPQLQVDLPIAQDLLGLGFAKSVVTEFARHQARVLEAVGELDIRSVRRPVLTSAYDTIRRGAQSVANKLGDYSLMPTTVARLAEIETSTAACIEAIWNAIWTERELSEEWKAIP